MGNPAIGLLEDLDRRHIIVGLPIALVAVLITEEILVGISLRLAAHLAQSLIIALHRIGKVQLGPVREDSFLALLGSVLGHDKLDLIAQRAADHRVGDTCVAGARIQDRTLARKTAIENRTEQHPEHRTILDRPAGVEILDLGVDLDAWLVEAGQDDGHQRRIADERQAGRVRDQGQEFLGKCRQRRFTPQTPQKWA